jgi:hypothetical protein
MEWDRLLALKYLSAAGGCTIDLSRTQFSMTVWDHCEENTISECSKQVTIKLMRTVIAKYFIKFIWVSSRDVLFSTQFLFFRLVIFLHHLNASQPSQEHLCSLKLVKDSPWTIKDFSPLSAITVQGILWANVLAVWESNFVGSLKWWGPLQRGDHCWLIFGSS